MESWITETINQFGYLGVFLLIALENLFPPVPSEIILTFAGFMTSSTTLSASGIIVASTLGSLFGGAILYYVGTWLHIGQLMQIVDRYGRVLGLKRADIHRANAWFHRYGGWTVFVCRLIPLVRSLISVPAGMAKMNIILFLSLTAGGALIWNAVLVYAGAAVGASWQEIVRYLSLYAKVVYLMLIVATVFFAGLLISRKKK